LTDQLAIVAVILGAIALGEPITWNLFAGTTIVLAGVAMSDRRLRRRLDARVATARGTADEPPVSQR
jgi:hypothetical protein